MKHTLSLVGLLLMTSVLYAADPPSKRPSSDIPAATAAVQSAPAPLPVVAPDVTSASEEAAALPFHHRMLEAMKHGKHVLRVVLIANDEEAEQMEELLEQVEHALEPPSDVEGFWAKKWDILKSVGKYVAGMPLGKFSQPPPVFDLRRSFTNLARVFRTSRYNENPMQREFLASSGTMFGITHGSEVVFGLITGTAAALHGNIPLALGLYSMVIPGLDDVGCLVGQGLIFFRPTRFLFNNGRKATVWLAGKAATKMRIPALMAALFEYEPARERILAAAAKHGTQVVDLEVPDEVLMRTTIKNKAGEKVMTLQFGLNQANEMVLQTATFNQEKLRTTPYSELKPFLKDLGWWNTIGAVREIQKLLVRGRADLIEEEKSFVEGVDHASDVDGDTVVRFREHAVAVTAKRHFVWPGSPRRYENCRVPFSALRAAPSTI